MQCTASAAAAIPGFTSASAAVGASTAAFVSCSSSNLADLGAEVWS